MGSPELTTTAGMTEVTTCFDSGFSGPRITDATLCKVYFALHSDFTDSKSCYLK